MNIFSGKHFGDILHTRDGRKAVFLGVWDYRRLGKSDLIYKCWIEGENEPIEYGEDGKNFHEAYVQFEDGTIETYGTDIS